jgi:lycopene beta-cyclase
VMGLNDGRHQIDWVMKPATGFGYDGPGQASVQIGDDRITCDWIFTSWIPGQRPDVHLWQHFHGWVIETSKPVFAADTMTLMDFDVPQHPTGAVFGYVLPYESTLALVEITSFSPTIWPREEYEHRLTDYIRSRYQLEPGMYSIQSTESGRIPMDAIQNPRQPNPATFPIGTIFGAVKPSTGYAFARMQDTCRHLAETLVQDGRPSYPKPASPRFAFYDALLIRIMRQWPEAVIPIFRSLFSNIPIDTIFRFLDEKSSLRQEIGIFFRLPFTPFLKSLWRHVTS